VRYGITATSRQRDHPLKATYRATPLQSIAERRYEAQIHIAPDAPHARSESLCESDLPQCQRARRFAEARSKMDFSVLSSAGAEYTLTPEALLQVVGSKN
jgi:hypothetical protein